VDKEQIRALKEVGAVWGWLKEGPTQPKATYFKRDDKGEIIPLPNLPADAESIRKYHTRGIVLDKAMLAPQAVEKSQEGALACEVCGKSFTHKIALAGHKKSHK